MKASQPYKYITVVKNGKHYIVFDFKDREGKRKRKWVNTELPDFFVSDKNSSKSFFCLTAVLS